MVPSGPRNAYGAVIAEAELYAEVLFVEAIDDLEFVVEGIGLFGDLVLDQLCGEAGLVDSSDFEGALPRETVHGHGEGFAVGGDPVVDFSFRVGAGGEGEEDGVSAAGFHELVDGVDLRPVDDISEGAVCVAEVPVHQAGPANGRSEVGRGSDFPAIDCFS